MSKENITAEEFFRKKVKEVYNISDKDYTALWRYKITAEEGMRWAHEYANYLISEKHDVIKELDNKLTNTCQAIERVISSNDIENNDIILHELLNTIDNRDYPQEYYDMLSESNKEGRESKSLDIDESKLPF